MSNISILQEARAKYSPKLPKALQNGANVGVVVGNPTTAEGDAEKIAELFKSTYGAPELTFEDGKEASVEAINVGVILSGGQAPGGHNVIAGIFDGIKSLNSDSKLYGFLGGPGGYVDNDYIELTSEIIDEYRNTGGFDIIGSGRTKLETTEQFDTGKANAEKLGIKSIVIIGGDDSNTNAALLAEYYATNGVDISVIGCPKTIDGDLKNEKIEASFGFDTATKVYSELIGNIQRDANSAKKYWHFIKLMGRSASHIGLECALKTQPNICIISEEVEAKKQTLDQIVSELVDVIAKRSANGENFGVALIPEGLVEFVPEMKALIAELNDLLAHEGDAFNALETEDEKRAFLIEKLGEVASKVYASLPELIQNQLMLDRDPHGNVQVSLIETEKLLIQMVSKKLAEMKVAGKFNGKFGAQNHFFGYEGRCAAPSNFDADYTYSLGYNAAALIALGKTGYMSSVQNLTSPADEWICGGVPVTMMMNVERRHGADKPVIKKALTELDGGPYKEFVSKREKWAIETSYVYPGPIQYWGPSEVCDIVTETLKLEQAK